MIRQRIVILTTRPEVWLCLLLAWILLSALRSYSTPWARAAGTEALHWGAGIFLVLGLGGILRRMTGAVQALTVLLGSLIVAIISEGRHADGLLVGPYGDHQLCASALLALLPFSLALALAPPTPAWRWGAQIITVVGALCLALTETRSAWIGTGVGAAVFVALWLRRPSCSLPTIRRHTWIVPVLLTCAVAGTFGLLVGGTDLSRPLTVRIQTLRSVHAVSQDVSWQARTQAWQGAAAMAFAHPVTGWGLGRYPSAQWAWTHTGRPLTPTQRPSLSEQAHDFYLQTLVETGLVGLALYLAALAALGGCWVQALRAHGRRPYGLRQALLIAAFALIAGQGVDALVSPSWQFPEVSLLFWAGLGLGLAATRPRQTETTSVGLPRPILRLLSRAATGTAAVAIITQFLPLGLLLPAVANYSPPGGTNFVRAYLSGPTTASAGSTVDYQILAQYNSGTSATNYVVNATGDSSASFNGTLSNFTVVGKVVIDAPNQVIYYTVPSNLSSGTPITLTGKFTDTSGSKHNATLTLTVQ